MQRRAVIPYLGVVPFLVFVGIFLVYPTLIVVVGAFDSGGGTPTLDGVRTAVTGANLDAFRRSIVLSASTAVLGAVLGALLAYAVAVAGPQSRIRRGVTAACGVLAQFGGVMLAFAFIATIGGAGLVTVLFQDQFGVSVFSGGNWLFTLAGLGLVYTYFQIPLMVLVFLPALDGIKPQWREATESVGGSTWQYWRHVAGPILFPPFLGSTLLLFANAFSSYATAAALISQGSPIVTLKIRGALSSEVGLTSAVTGKALGLGMIVVMAVVMTAYAVLQRRTARWLR
jgi:putative spermidine/putrescine transport system permease protein